jgi:hypothetical protein
VSTLHGNICEITLDKAVSFAKVELSVFGFKTFVVNVRLMREDSKKELVADIGSVRLSPTALPTIEQITLSSTSDGGHSFKLSLHNNSKTEWFVSGLGIIAYRGINGRTVCAMPTPIEFGFASELKLVGGGGSNRVEGKVTESSEGQLYSLTASGRLVDDVCERKQSLDLSCDAAFELPAKEFQTVEVTIPDVFVIKDTRGLDLASADRRQGLMQQFSTKPKLVGAATIHFAQFPRWRIVMMTKAENESYIAGDYVVGLDPLLLQMLDRMAAPSKKK